MSVGTGTTLKELEYSWFATRSGLSGSRTTREHKRAYYISELGARANDVPLSQLEYEWLHAQTGVSSNAIADMWREAVVGAGLTPETTILNNKRKYYSNVA